MKEAYRNVSISFITLNPLREASYTKQKGEKMVDFLCCLKSKKTPVEEVEEVEEKIKRKKKKLTKDEKRKKTFLFIGKENEKKKTTEGGKLKRKLFFLRRASKKKKQSKDDNSNSNNKKKRKRKCNKMWRTEQKKGNNLVSLVKSISLSNGKHRSAADEILRIGSENIAARVFTYRELSAATANFSTENRLGEGGFGRVYKGQLKGNNEIVAVKLLDRNGCLGTRDFLVEILMLSLLHHPNLVKLLGYCTDGDQRVLVYEYMPMGSIEDQLLGAANGKKQPLDWHTRIKLAAEAAKGLEYLHEIANPPVIYKDFKASNVVLDENFNVKLSDFGLAKVSPAGDKNDNLSPRVMGTYGYCAPECVLAGQMTKMSDVYSFGVVLLQLITGRKAVDLTRPRGQQHLVHWAEPLFKDRRHFVAMADPQLKGKHPMKGLYQAIAIAAMCLQEEPTIRPLISDVFSALNYLANPKNDDDGDIPAASVATNTRASCGLEKVLHSAAMPSGSEIKQDEFVEPEEMKEARSCPEDDSFASIETGIK